MKGKVLRRQLLLTTVFNQFMRAAGIGVVTALAMAGTAVPAQAQQKTGAFVSGQVVDQAGAPVAGARVTLSSSSTGYSRTITTEADGRYRFPSVPFGAYELTATADGFRAIEPAPITASVDDATFDIALARTGAPEEIVVTGVRRTLTQSATTAGITVDVTELSGRVPVGRDVNAIALLAPTAVQGDGGLAAGTRGGRSLISLGGASVAENVYYVNGLSVTDSRNLLGGSQPPFEFLDQVQIKSGGYEAEYGRTTGGAIVATTKRGTNEFRFGASGYFTPDALRGGYSDLYTGNNTSFGHTRKQTNWEGNIYASGPLVEDRVFFYALVSPRKVEETGRGSDQGTLAEFEESTPFYGARVDANIFEGHRVDYTFFRNKSTNTRTTYTWSPTTGRGDLRGTRDEESGGDNHIVRYAAELADWATLSATYGRYEFNQTDIVSDDNIPLVQDLRSGPARLITRQTVGGPVENGRDVRDQYRLDADFYFDLAGSHRLRVGVDLEELETVNRSDYTGTEDAFFRLRRLANGTEVVDVQTYRLRSNVKTENAAFYIQDSWKLLNDRLTLDLGLRYDMFEAFNTNGESFVKIDDQFAPRLGVSYDLTEDGKHQVYGFYGRYYLPIATNTNARLAGSELFTLERYQLLGLNPDNTPRLGALLARNVIGDGSVADARTITDQGLEAMYDEEFIAGYRLNLDEWNFGVRATYRDLKSTIEDTALAEVLREYCRNRGIAVTDATCNGAYALDSETPNYFLFNPGRGATLFWDLDGNGSLERLNFTERDITQPAAKREYTALEFTFERPFDGDWGLQGSYVLSYSKGNYEGPVKSDIDQDDPSITQDFDHINSMLNADGYLPNDRRHTFKLFGTYSPFENFQIGANVLLQSGRPLSCIGYQPLQTPGTAGSSPSGFACLRADGTYEQLSRGKAGRTEWRERVDLQFAYKLQTELPGEAMVTLDLSNVFDQKNVLSRVEYRELSFQPTRNFLQPNDVEAPFSARFGLSYRY